MSALCYRPSIRRGRRASLLDLDDAISPPLTRRLPTPVLDSARAEQSDARRRASRVSSSFFERFACVHASGRTGTNGVQLSCVRNDAV